MTTIQSSTYSPAAATDQTRTTTSSVNKSMGQEDFFRLMVAQMKSQDPTKPMDGQQQLAQLAQFSTLQSIQELQVSFDNLAKEIKAAVAASK